MNRIIAIAAIILLYPWQGMGAGYKENWKRGTEHYMQKQYDSAAWYFEQVAALSPQNAEVYYNLGNTYYRLNRIAPAVLNYQRALNIDPDYKEAKDNLAITQARISHTITPTEDIFFITWWKSLTAHTKATGWAVAALITFILIIASVWVRKYQKGGYRLPVQVPGILGFICACFLMLGFVAAGNKQRSPGAVVIESDAPLMNYQQKGKPIALIPEGTTVEVAGEKDMWVEVVLPDGRSGWLLKVQVTKI
jgi:hypothetical protein